jgi:hypothetical protein
MTLKFTTEETVRIMKHVRVAATVRDGMTVDRAFELAQLVVSREWNPGREPGTYVTDSGEVRAIRAPRRRQPEPQSIKRLVPVSIESLDDGDVEAGVEELLPPTPTPVAGEEGPEEIDDETDEETAPFENAADAAAEDGGSDGDGE